MLGMKVASKIGSIRSICLVSSTWVTEHIIQGVFEPVLKAALLRNLHEEIIQGILVKDSYDCS